MNANLLGFFSGFPTHHFTDSIADVLKEELNIRDNLVFIAVSQITMCKTMTIQMECMRCLPREICLLQSTA